MNKLADAYLDTLYAEGFEPPAPPLTDPADAILDLDIRCTQLEEQVAKLNEMMRTQLTINTRLIRQMQDQSTPAPQSAIILPDRFN